MVASAYTEAAGPPASVCLEYDGSWTGLLCSVAELLNIGRGYGPPGSAAGRDGAALEAALPPVRSQYNQPGLFEERIAVASDQERAASCLQRIGRRAGSQALLYLRQAFDSDQGRHNRDTLHQASTPQAGRAGGGPPLEAALALVLYRLYWHGPAILKHLADPASQAVQKAQVRCSRQTHLFKGLCRFAELRDGSLYAAVSPDCDILAYLAQHFAARLGNQSWIIYDQRRETAELYSPGRGRLRLVGFRLDQATPPGKTGLAGMHSEAEAEIQALWRRYFQAVSIDERRNPRYQRAFLPLKHRYHLPEFAATDDCQSGTISPMV